jgi:PST family polysaccharide transporter
MLILPLISYPYLIRVVGSENFGTVVYALSIIAFFHIFIKFGFEVSAVKNVAENSNNNEALSIIVSSILFIQLSFYIIGFLFLYVLTSYYDPFVKYQKLLFFAYLSPLFDIFLLVWFFQGMEKMKYITVINIVAGLFGLSFIFIFIQEKTDYIYIPLFQAISLAIGGIFSLFLILKKERIFLQIPEKNTLLFYFKESSVFFLSRLSLVFNHQINIILLANFVNLNTVAYYDLAKKIIEAFKVLMGIIDNTMYPHIAKTKNIILAKKVLFIKIVLSLFFVLLLLLFDKQIVLFLGGFNMMNTLPILKIYSYILVLTSITYYIGSTILVSFGYSKIYNLSVIYASLIYMMILYILYIMNIITTINIIYAMIFVELLVALYRLYYCRKYQLL